MAVRRMTLAAREARLAYVMLAPTFAVILAIVLVPVLLNVWISFKSVTLADLRAPVPVANERVLQRPAAAGDELLLRLTMRNGSQRVTLYGVTWEKTLPAGLTLASEDGRCAQDGGVVRCAFGDWLGGYRETLELAFVADAAYLAAGSPDVRDVPTDMGARAENVLTSFTFTLDNYRRILAGSDFWPTLRVTLGYTFFSAVGSILLGLFAAMLLNGSFTGQGLLRGLFLFPYVAPVIAVAFVWAFFLDPFSGTVNALGQRWDLLAGPVNFLGQRAIDVSLLGMTFEFPLALTTVIVFSSWNYFPFAFLFILARLQAVPIDMYEAADVDGAGPFQKFWFITLPNLAGILAVLFLLRFMFLINKFEDIFLLTGGAAGTKNLPVMIYDEAFARSDIGSGSAVAMILFAVLLAFMFVYYRFAPESEPVTPTPTLRHRSPSGTLLAAVVGGLTVPLVVALWSLTATLVGGLVTTLPLGVALLLGLALGAGVGLIRRGHETPTAAAVGAGALLALAWLLLSGLRPLGGEAVRPVWGVAFAFLTLGLAGHLVRFALRGIDLGRLRRDVVERIVVRLLRGFAFAFFLLIILFPFWYMLSASLKGRAALLRDPASLVIDFGLGARELFVGYREVLFLTFDLLGFIGNSFVVALVTMTVTLVMAVLGAYAVTRLAFPGRTILSRSILLIYMFPAIVLVIPLYAVFTQLGLRNTLPGLLLVYPATTIPVALYMLRSYFQTLPKDLEEAGLIDGCTRAQVIWRITLPLSMPAIASVGLYVFMIAWNEFLFAFMFLDNPAIFTLPRGMVMLDSQEVPRQYLMAGAMIITLPIMILFFWFEKYLVGGLTAGGVKG